MFDSVLVANRGEIAVRVFRTLRRLGIRSVAVHTDADARARHVREADEALQIPSYLDIDAVISAARDSGASAVHPGYGFLAENTAFARACGEAGLVFIGPPTEAIDAMGDKIRAKQTVAAAGVPVVPGRDEPGLSDAELEAAALEVGLPVLLKPSAGGGGKGMRLVRDAADLAEAIASARREARPVRRRHAARRAVRGEPAAHRDPGLRTRTATPSTWASASAACSAATRRSSRRRRRRCWTPRPGSGWAPPPSPPRRPSDTWARGRSSTSSPPTGPTSSSSWR